MDAAGRIDAHCGVSFLVARHTAPNIRILVGAADLHMMDNAEALIPCTQVWWPGPADWNASGSTVATECCWARGDGICRLISCFKYPASQPYSLGLCSPPAPL